MFLLVDNESKHTLHLKRFLKKRGIRFVSATKKSSLPAVMGHRYQGVILSGGPLNYAPAICLEEVSLNFVCLLDLSVPILGICFGHETIAEAFGGKVGVLTEPVNGPHDIDIIQGDQLFRDLPRTCEMHQAHGQYVREAPHNFSVLARSARCPVEAMRHKKKPIYGVQFHPEVSGEAGHRLLANFVSICRRKRRKKH